MDTTAAGGSGKSIYVVSDLARRRTEVIAKARHEGVAIIRDTDGAALALVPGGVIEAAAMARRCAELLTAAVQHRLPLVADWSDERRGRFVVDLASAVDRALAIESFAPVEALLAASRPNEPDPVDVIQLQRAAAVVARLADR